MPTVAVFIKEEMARLAMACCSVSPRSDIMRSLLRWHSRDVFREACTFTNVTKCLVPYNFPMNDGLKENSLCTLLVKTKLTLFG